MSDYRKFDAALQSAGVCYKTDEPMSAHTSFKIGGPADRFVEVKTVSELQAVLNAVCDENVPYFILGNGSNLLVPDEGLRGAVLTLQGDFKKVQSLANGHVLCGAGASLATVCSFARGQGLTGLEFAWGIPGQLGGAVYMNAGAYGGEMKQVVERVHFLEADGTPGVMSGEDLAFGYRKAPLWARSASSQARSCALKAVRKRRSPRKWKISCAVAAKSSRSSCRAQAAYSSARRAILPVRSLNSAA